MSLQQYCDKRLVVQNSSTSAYNAARALQSNHIGAIVVQDAGVVTGIVTDRDLALRVIGNELEAKRVTLNEVMTHQPATVSVDDSEAQVFDLMRDRHIRRIPIVDGRRVAGLVSLDDLLLRRAVEPELAAEIVEAQLSDPAPNKPRGKTHPARDPQAIGPAAEARAWRRYARAEQTLQQFTRRLQEVLGWSEGAQALLAFEIVAAGLMQRLTPNEASHFAAQLPSAIGGRLLELESGPDPSVTVGSVDEEVALQLDLDLGSARQAVRRIGAAMHEFVSEGELADMVSQLPTDMKLLVWPR